MCGICGKYSDEGVSPDLLRRMLEAIAHRGPDDEGVLITDRIGMGTRRLSIIDLAGGHQPISNEDETIWVVYNGEIYNHKLLRRELEHKGHSFRTRSDTEVIVHLYEELGERCVDRLRGMFAFAIWDEKQKRLVLARDRIGQKPLFYAQEGGDFLFASEIKAILAASKRGREIDYESLHHYLSLRFIPSPGTMLRHIRKLPPAHILVWEDGRISSVSRYWDLSFHEKQDLPDRVLVESLDEKLRQTIDSHLVSDVPVGAFLSGGMDSSMVVAIMANDLTRSFKTFTVGVKEQNFDELPYARMVADRYHTFHIEERVNANLINFLPKMIWHLDEPSDPIAACQFYAAELAARHVKVVLGGDGGDELFAGFDRYLGVGYIDHYMVVPSFIRRRLIGPLLGRVPESFGYKSVTQKLRWFHDLSLLPSTGERYAEATCFFRFNHEGKKSLFSDALWSQVGEIDSTDAIITQFENAKADDVIDRMLYADFMTRLSEHSLMLTDRMSMAHGLEVRSPFLDHELVEFMTTFPSYLKIRGRELKYVLRRLAEDYLPERIIEREKQGFMFPVAYWFRNELYPFIKHLLLDSHFVKEGFFRKERVLRLIEDHRQSHLDNHVRLWMLLSLEIWHQMYIRQRDMADLTEEMQSYL